MDEKLRRWLESRCRALPDGGWLVEVPVVGAVSAPAYVLPDEPTRQEYLPRAVRAGRTRLFADFLFIILFFPFKLGCSHIRCLGFDRTSNGRYRRFSA